MKINRKARGVLLAIAAFIAFVVVNNCSAIPSNTDSRPSLLAHRGLAQTFDIESVKWDTNTASIIHKPEHPYIENTIPSMRAAFDYGADIVEFDIRVTKDKELAVFHDYNVDFRTEGKGAVSDYTLRELKTLDVGYGYTHDGGTSFPLRGTGVGLMPSMDEVLEAFPEKEFLIHIRDDGDEIGILLLEKFKQMSEEELQHISIYGNDDAIERIKREFPGMKALSKKIMTKAFIDYTLIGWSGIIPGSMKNIQIHMPNEYARFLWGWPHKFLERMDTVNTRFVLVTKKGSWSGGFDSAEDLKRVPKGYSGCIWTERIDIVNSLLRGQDQGRP